MNTSDAKERLFKIVGEMRKVVREQLEDMKADSVSCITIEDVRIILTEHYNFVYRPIYEDR